MLAALLEGTPSDVEPSGAIPATAHSFVDDLQRLESVLCQDAFSIISAIMFRATSETDSKRPMLVKCSKLVLLCSCKKIETV